ncbi:hypothetical protein N7472_003835 [Penicillium cf. griseofulvum]|uniref:Uncharacterized protein n=1 Tax=Penicillium cf. griseofulvum TaxID=2972120 RepID=A0A9W9MTS9_9EURO|nr:hypothetical protein N7472_003835 [Penicillium cf. griseofulvum]
MRQSVHRDVMPYPAYDCLASRIVDAPGASACSAEQICSDKALLQSWNIQFPHRYKDGYMAFTGLVAGISITAFVMICARGVFPLIASMTKGKSARRWREIARAIDFGFAGSLGVAGAGCIVVGVITAADAIGAFDHSREGAVALNWDCNALHVNVSPWRYYLDVDYELPLRVARTWFNS